MVIGKKYSRNSLSGYILQNEGREPMTPKREPMTPKSKKARANDTATPQKREPMTPKSEKARANDTAKFQARANDTGFAMVPAEKRKNFSRS